MNVCFEIAAFFIRLNGEGKRAAISKLTFIWTPSSRSYIVFALVTGCAKSCSVTRRMAFEQYSSERTLYCIQTFPKKSQQFISVQ